MTKITETQLLEMYNLVFSRVHSDGFKTAEMKSLLFDKEYTFLERPNENWYGKLTEYINTNSINETDLNINPLFKN